MDARTFAAAACLAAALVVGACGGDAARPATPPESKGESALISDEQAVAAARAACADRVAIPATSRPRVEFAGGRCVVTFPTDLPKGTRGADWHARVTLDARTGAVLEVLGGD
jgi:hypothetical protein